VICKGCGEKCLAESKNGLLLSDCCEETIDYSDGDFDYSNDRFLSNMKIMIPNCKKCKWKNNGLVGPAAYFCGAQGAKSCSEVYNNELCKELYEPKEDESK
jgi:hypothetical protein